MLGWLSRLVSRKRRQSKEIVLRSPRDLPLFLPPAFEGELKSVVPHQLIATWKAGKPVWTDDWTLKTSVEHGLRVCSWVFACVFRRMKSIASVPWYVEKWGAEGWQRVQEHPALDLLNNPNPYWSRLDLFETLMMHLDLDGNAIWTKTRLNNGTVQELWVISPDNIKPVPGDFAKGQDYIVRYEAKREGSNEKFAVDTDDVVHFQFKDPLNPYWGSAPIKSAGRSIDTDVESVKWNKTAIQNRAVTDGVFTFDGRMTRAQWEEMRTMVADQHMGSASARYPWVLGNDAKWTQMSLSPVDMDFMEGRKFTRVEVCSVYGVPPPLIGDYEKATLANIAESRTIYWVDTVIPLLDDLMDTLNRSLAPEFGDDIRYNYDISKVQAMFPILVERIKATKELWSMGVPLNTATAFVGLGLPRVDGGDIGYVAGNLLPAGGIQEEE